MGVLGGNLGQQQRSVGGVLGRQQREEEEARRQQYQSHMQAMPDLYNPAKQMEAAKERLTLPSPSSSPAIPQVSATDQWIEDRLAQDREQASKTPVFKAINKVIEPVSRLVYGAQAKIPGVAAFQEGAGDALGIETFTPPITGPAAVNVPARVVGNIAGSLTNPSNISQGLVTAPLQAGQGVSQAVAKKVPALGNRYAQRGIEGAVAGGIQGGVISGVRGETDAGELATNIGIGVGLGAAGDIALAGLSDAARAVIGRYRGRAATPSQPALPAPRERGNANQAQTPDVVTPEYTFGLPEPSPATEQRLRNVEEGRADLKVIDDEIRQLEASYERAVVDEYKYLKQSLQERGGVQQGQLQVDASGNVTGRTGRVSNNPLWYQEYYAANGKTPSNRELFRLARERVDNGFRDEAGDVPSWRSQNLYDDTLSALQDVRGTLQQSIRELDPAINVTDSPLVSRELAFTPQRPSEVTPGPVAPDVDVPRAPDLPAADTSLGITPIGKQGRTYAETDTRSHIATKTDRERIDVGKVTDDFYKNQVNNLQWLDEFDKFVEKSTGQKLRPDERSYVLALNSRGADMTARHMLTERLVDSQGRVIGKSLKDITSQIPSNKQVYDNFVDYLIARHAPTRMLRGEKVYAKKLEMTPEAIEAKVAEYEKSYPEFAQIAEDLDQWNDTIGRAWLVDTGIIPENVFNAWREQNPYWIPNKRHFTELEKRQQAVGARRGFGNQSAPVKAYNKEGSERKIIDPFESLIEYTDRYVKTARRNEVMQTVYRQLEKHPEELDGFATVLRREKLDEKAMDEDGVAGLIDQLDDEFNQAFLKKSDLEKDNVVSALIDGERVYMRIDNPEFLEALVNVTPITRHAVVEGARKITNAMKMLTTGINPIFGLTRNIFRDIPEAFIYSKTTNNPFRYAWDTLEAFVSVFADGAGDAVRGSRLLQKVTPESFRNFLDDKARLYKDYKALGGGHSSPAASNRNLLAQSKRDLLPQQRSGARAFGQRAWAALENLNNALESGPRLGEFKRSRQAGSDTYGSRVKGIFEAQDVTTNFKRHGQVVREADAFVPYLNAAVQGLDKFIRSFKDRPVGVTAKALSMIAAPTIALYALNHNNPNYQKLNNYTKDNFYLLPTTDGTFIKIPKPRELGVPFGGLLERTMRAWADDDPEAFRDFADTAKSMFAPPVIGRIINGENPFLDTAAGPTLEVLANKNFTGSPIVPGYLEGLSPRNQYDANTSEVGKKVGDLLNVSPKQVDHLIRGYTGVLGQIGLPATTEGSTVGETLTRQMTADPVFSTDASRNFYELKDKLDTKYADAKHTGEVPKGYNDDARKYMGQVSEQMSEYTKAMRDIEKMDELSKEQKKEYKRQLTDERNELARQAYEQVREALKGSG